jgi:hypothetical protein
LEGLRPSVIILSLSLQGEGERGGEVVKIKEWLGEDKPHSTPFLIEHILPDPPPSGSRTGKMVRIKPKAESLQAE